MFKHSIRTLAMALPLPLLIVGCSDSNNPGDTLGSGQAFSFEVTITNLTAGQPLSPAALVIHRSDWRAFTLGEPASSGLEVLAEDGSNGDFVAEAEADSLVLATASGTGAIGPGSSEQLSISASSTSTGLADGLRLTWAAMPINTNDGLAAVSGVNLQDLAVGDSQTLFAISYDAGTEANSETADTIPGPAASGLAEGFNAARDDVRDAVYIHSGVVTQDDGLSSSTLDGTARWDNPIASIRIERTN
jgi:hypothetical protein